MYVHGIETADSRKILFEDLTNEHLANWIFHAEKDAPIGYDDHLRRQLRREAAKRGLAKEFIDRADGSFLDDKGVRRRVNKRTGLYEVVQ